MSLVVKDLTKKYGNKTVLDRLSFSMEKPGVYGLVGPNGAGKTTAIRAMLGMLAKDGGSVTWKGGELNSATCNVGYLAEERGLYPKYTLMDQLLYFTTLRGVDKETAKERIKYWAKRLEVTEYLYPAIQPGGRKAKAKTADQLSKGNQQKIQFMISLLSNPELLILDEPLSGLDPVNTDLFKSVIQEQIDTGKYLIMSSHQMATVEEFCTDITILHRSKTVLQGNLNEIKKSYGRINLYVKTEEDILSHIMNTGVKFISQIAYDYTLKVTGEAQANALLASLVADGITVVSFDLREPSLHEIFVEKVGSENEDF